MSGDVHLGVRVSRIEERADGVVVTTADGREIAAPACVVTAPLGALGGIEFTAALPAPAQQVVADGQSSQGFKFWIRARGVDERFVAMAQSTEPISPGHVSAFVSWP